MSDEPALLSIHAVDNLGEEGVLADAAVCAELEVRPLMVVTSVLVGGPRSADALEDLSLAMVRRQFESVLGEARPAVARTGILHGASQVELVAELLQSSPVPETVVAPVVRVGGTRVLEDQTLVAMRARLFPQASLLVVRAGDVEALAGRPLAELDSLRQACEALREQGAASVLVVGFASRGRVLDVLDDRGDLSLFDAARVAAPRVRGLGGAHVAALACHLARGRPLRHAVDAAQRYVSLRLQRGR